MRWGGGRETGGLGDREIKNERDGQTGRCGETDRQCDWQKGVDKEMTRKRQTRGG